MRSCLGIAVAGMALTATLLAGDKNEMADQPPSGSEPSGDLDKMPLVIPDLLTNIC